MFALDHPLAEAAWHGLAHDRHLLTQGAEAGIKAPLLSLLSGEAAWSMDPEARRRLVGRMVVLCGPLEGRGGPVIRFDEARRVLMAGDDGDRAAALGALSEMLEAGRPWPEIAGPFLTDAWPRQIRFRSEATSRALARVAEAAGEHFPDAAATVLPLLGPVPHMDAFVYRAGGKGGAEGHARRHPGSVLALLDALVEDDRTTAPWNMRELLDALAEAEPPLRAAAGWQRLDALAR